MVNLVDLIETENTTMTNPGNYYGPEVSPFGVVIDNRDEQTHSPETDAEYKKRKKKKEQQLNPNVGPSANKDETTEKNESYIDMVSSITTALLESEDRPNKAIGPITSNEMKEFQSFSKEERAAGRKVEMEHTTNPQIADRIALAHLKEDPKYYNKLKAVESNKS